jgi:hypothetical protein
MQAITVKFLPATNFKGSRYKATAAAGSVTLHSDHVLNPAQNAAQAALALCAKYQWAGNLIEGGLHSGEFVFVFAQGQLVVNPYMRNSLTTIKAA